MMINASWDEINRNYKIHFQTSKKTSGAFLTLDTGAGATVLGINLLISEGILSSENSDYIAKTLDNSKVVPRVFYSASRTAMLAYPCSFTNFYLDGELIKTFYFYLVVGGGNPDVSLLGTDFLNFCQMYKEPQGDICLVDFNFNKYEEDFKRNANSGVIFPLNSVYNKKYEREDTKDIASAFRQFIETTQKHSNFSGK